MLTAAVTPAAATGTVQFMDGSTNIGDPVIVSNGKATQSTSTLSVGSHQLSAVFAPADPARFGPSTAQAVPFTISGATPTNIVVSTSVGVVALGEAEAHETVNPRFGQIARASPSKAAATRRIAAWSTPSS
jgi:hypothetical protein